MVPPVLLEIEDGDYSDNGVITVIVLNVIIFAVILLVYSMLQASSKYDYVFAKRSSEKVGPGMAGMLAVRGLGLPELRPKPAGFLGWVSDIFNTTLTEVMARSGLSAAAYLLFLRNNALSFLVVGIVCGGPLMGTNSHEDENQRRDARNDPDVLDLRGFADWTTSNIRPKSDLLWVHLGALVLVTAAVLYGVVRTLREYRTLRRTYREKRVVDVAEASARHAVMLRPRSQPGTASAIGSGATPRDAAAWAANACGVSPHDYLGAVHSPELLDLRARELTAERGLAHGKSWLKAKGVREQVKAGKLAPVCGAKVDAIEHFSAELKTVRKEIDAALAAKLPDTGVRFLVMPSESDAIALTTRHPKATIGGVVYDVLPAPRPDQVAWNNLRFDQTARSIRRVLMGIFIAVLCVFWAVPLGFLSSLEQIAAIPGVGGAFEALLDMPPVLLGFISAYLPVIAAVVLNIIIILLIQRFALMEGHHSLQRVYTRSQQIFYAFTLCSVVVFPALIVGVLASASSLSENFEDSPTDAVLELLAQIVAPKSGFFFAYVVQLALMGTALKLLRVGPLLVSGFKLSRAVTEEDREAALTVAPFRFFVEYGFALLVGSLVLIFALTVPITTVFGFVYFGLKYATDKTAIVNTFPQEYATNGAILASAAHRTIFGVIAGQIAAVVLFISKEAWPQFGIAVAMLLFTSAWLAYNAYVLNRDIDGEDADLTLAAAKRAPKATDQELDVMVSAYRHPGLSRLDERRDELRAEFGVAKKGVIIPLEGAEASSEDSYSAASGASSSGSSSRSSSSVSYDDSSYETTSSESS